MYYSIRPTEPFTDATGFVDLATLRQWVRTDESEEAFLNSLLLAAMDMAEDTCNQPLFEREYLVQLPRFANGKLPVLNVPNSTTITSTYIGVGSADAVVIEAGKVSLINGQVVFDQALHGLSDVSRVELRMNLGYPADKLPNVIKIALQYIVNFFYDNRDDAKRTMPTVSDALLQPYKRYPV